MFRFDCIQERRVTGLWFVLPIILTYRGGLRLLNRSLTLEKRSSCKAGLLDERVFLYRCEMRQGLRFVPALQKLASAMSRYSAGGLVFNSYAFMALCRPGPERGDFRACEWCQPLVDKRSV